ncbi:FecR domain-containing protein [Rhodopirellula sp. JC740]|uniref:FecR domain-containing protein n=1 Tax=Rhodopirellula halodulae TaxID=2894198 RepID=A0ABS8NK69_9BACT|nr:LamG-like jellyroll fold domain-containing protein [Rhodopirellula sp. JC740]MCC9643357.1 FecR domain-containing protein [Rhodopirellula sp. JC740]
MDNQLRKWIYQTIDQTIEQGDFDALQDRLETDEEARAEYLKAVNLSESLHEIASTPEPVGTTVTPAASFMRWPGIFAARSLMIAASTLILVSGIAYWIGHQQSNLTPIVASSTASGSEDESLIAGHATLRRAFDVRWGQGHQRAKVGDVLGHGPLRLESGLAEIDFFCGATLIVEGPAELDIESDWSVRVDQGRLRATVPPAARGFRIKTADSEVIDLGTEFTMDVSEEQARVEVVDGEIMLRGGDHDGLHLLTGERRTLMGAPSSESIEGLATSSDLLKRDEAATFERFRSWRETNQAKQNDERLIAHYSLSTHLNGRTLSDATSNPSQDGLLLGPAQVVEGRFGEHSQGVNFDRPGARIRTRIDGQFEAFTFACWVKIDDLQQRYNALFMGDGYENGEPHWQIRDDGRLMFSVMVDDSREIEFYNKRDQRVVKDAGLHRVYMTEPFWDISKSGQWFHLVSVYDPSAKRVRQYINGQLVSEVEIEQELLVKDLRIGPAEIGNWGQPFRETPWFAVRNLDGTLDELSIYNAALTGNEIETLYESGKPVGY